MYCLIRSEEGDLEIYDMTRFDIAEDGFWYKRPHLPWELVEYTDPEYHLEFIEIVTHSDRMLRHFDFYSDGKAKPCLKEDDHPEGSMITLDEDDERVLPVNHRKKSKTPKRKRIKAPIETKMTKKFVKQFGKLDQYSPQRPIDETGPDGVKECPRCHSTKIDYEADEKGVHFICHDCQKNASMDDAYEEFMWEWHSQTQNQKQENEAK